MDGLWLWVELTTLQTLAFYNAVANIEMVKPRFIEKIQSTDKQTVNTLKKK